MFLANALPLAFLFASADFSCSQNELLPNNQMTPMPMSIKPTLVKDPTQRGRVALSVPAVLPYGGFLFPLGSLCTESIRLALTNVYRTKGLLDDYELNIEMVDDECSRPVHVERFLETLERSNKHRIPLMLGTLCGGAQYTGPIMKYYNYVGMTTMAITEVYDDRRRYDGYFLATPSIATHVKALVAVWQKIGFRKVAVLSETVDYFQDTETVLFREMAALNMSLVAYSKVIFTPGIPVEQGDIQRAVEEIARTDARVILIYTNYASKLACWLHHYGIYGRGYALFVIRFSYFTKNDPGRYNWCTEEMLDVVIRSIIFFGTGEDIDVYGKELPEDSIGTSGANFTQYLRETIVQPERLSTWWAPWRIACYDITVGAAMWLNETESRLKQQGDSLANWVVGSNNFRTNGTWFRSLMKESALSLHFRTIGSRIAIDPLNGGNVYGNAPYIFYQVQPTNEAFDLDGSPVHDGLLPTLLYAFLNGSELIQMDKVNWLTHDGNAPLDSIVTVFSIEPLITLESLIALSVFAFILIATNVFLFIYHSLNEPPADSVRRAFSGFSRILVAGHIILLVHILVLPYDTSGDDVGRKCSFSYSFLSVGYSLILMCLVTKLELVKFLRFYANNNNKLFLAKTGAKPLLLILVMWVSFSAILISFLFIRNPLSAVQRKVSETISPLDISVIFIETQVVCEQAERSLEIPIAIAVGHILVAFRALFLCATIKPKNRTERFWRDLRRSISAVSFTLSGMLFSALVGGAIFSSQIKKMTLTLSTVSIAVVAFNTTVLLAPNGFGKISATMSGATSVALRWNTFVLRKTERLANYLHPAGMTQSANF